MGGRGGEDSTNSIGCSAHTQYMSTPLTTSLHSGSWAVGPTLPHPPAPPTLRCYCTVECIAVHQHTSQTAPAVSLEDVDGADGTFDLTLLVGPLHCRPLPPQPCRRRSQHHCRALSNAGGMLGNNQTQGLHKKERLACQHCKKPCHMTVT